MTARGWAATSQADVVAAADDWLRSPALSAVAAALGGPAINEVPADLPGFAHWAGSVLNTRRMSERHEAEHRDLPQPVVETLLHAAGELGLLSTTGPALRDYRMTVVLGGTTTGNRLRTQFATDLERQGSSLGAVTVLSAHRPLTATELRDATRRPDELTEWQNLLGIAAAAFRAEAGQSASSLHRQARSREGLDIALRRGGGRKLRLLVAPSDPAGRRANTSESLAYLVGRVPADERRTLLLVTSAIYAPYQYFASAPLLLAANTGYLELVGTPTSTNGDRQLLAQRIAQEIYSAISAALNLWPERGEASSAPE